MSEYEDVFQLADESIPDEDWADNLRDMHVTRTLARSQIEDFYSKRRTIEYGVKTTLAASMATALVLGGPPFWIMGGAALMLKVTTLCLNRFNPAQYIEIPQYQALANNAPLVGADQLAAYRTRWHQDQRNNFFEQHEKSQCFLLKKLAFALTMSYVIFTVLNATLTLPILLAGLLCAAALVEQASQEQIPYVEDDEMITSLSV